MAGVRSLSTVNTSKAFFLTIMVILYYDDNKFKNIKNAMLTLGNKWL